MYSPMGTKGRLIIDVGQYTALVRQTFEMLLPHLPADEQVRAGGYYAHTDARGRPFFVFEVGDSPDEKREGRFERALDKPRCAAQAGHNTSRSLKNAQGEPYTGSMWGDRTARHGGFAGLPGDFDEMLVANVLVLAGDMSVDAALQRLRPNKTFQSLKHLFGWADPRLV